MFTILFWVTDNACITWTVSTIFVIICWLIGIDAFADRYVCFFIANRRAYSSIERVEVPKSVPVIVCIHIFYYATIQCVDVLHSLFCEER